VSITQINVSTPANELLFTDTAMGGTIDAVKGSSAIVYYVYIDNTLNGAPSYVKLYNLAGGSVTVGTTVPDMVLIAPANARITQNFFTTASPGVVFGTALSAACTTAGGTAGSTSPGSSVIVTIAYV
jgi:hypothetical protein